MPRATRPESLRGEVFQKDRRPGDLLPVSSGIRKGWDGSFSLGLVLTEGNVALHPGEAVRKQLDDGQVIVVMPQLFDALLVIGPADASHWERGWRYGYLEDAMEAARVWDGQGEPSIKGRTRTMLPELTEDHAYLTKLGPSRVPG